MSIELEIEQIKSGSIQPALDADGISSPFKQTEGEIIFSDEFLERIPPQTPYQSQIMEYHGFIPREQMKGITTMFAQGPKEEVFNMITATSRWIKYLSKFAGTHRALDLMYLGPNPEKYGHDDYLKGRFWLENVENCIAIRNRFRLVRSAVIESLQEQLSEPDREVRILSIASGSSRAVLEAMRKFKELGLLDRIHARMVDISAAALHDSARIAKSFGLEANVELRQSDFRQVDEYAEGYQANVIEIVGLLDYFGETRVVDILSKVREHSAEGGSIIFSNVMPNHESDFIDKSVSWPPMKYRTEEDLSRIIRNSGFSSEDTIFTIEPMSIHCLVNTRE